MEPTISLSFPLFGVIIPYLFFKLSIDASRPVDNKWGVRAIVRYSKGMLLAAAAWDSDALPDVNVDKALRF